MLLEINEKYHSLKKWKQHKETTGLSSITTAKGEGHISKQCTMPKRKRDEKWFNDKVLLVQAQASGQVLTEEEIAFLADPGLPDTQTSYTNITPQWAALSSR
ncbi:hypothetical protein Tco_1144328 [Tanacetum coccineum]